MPVLCAEPICFPHDVLTGEMPAETGRAWRVVYTRSRQEKALARHLLSYEVPFYLPLVKQVRREAGRKLTTYAPLFAGYLFMCGNDDERVQCLRSNRVSTMFEVPATEDLRLELSQIQRLLESDTPVTVEQRLIPGDRVRIRRGRMQGVEGRVVSRRGSTSRLVVAINFLQQGASIEINDLDLELLSA